MSSPLAENVAVDINLEEVAGLALFLSVHTRAHTSHVVQIGLRAPWDLRDLHATPVDVLEPERADIHCQCGAVLDGCRFVSC